MGDHLDSTKVHNAINCDVIHSLMMTSQHQQLIGMYLSSPFWGDRMTQYTCLQWYHYSQVIGTTLWLALYTDRTIYTSATFHLTYHLLPQHISRDLDLLHKQLDYYCLFIHLNLTWPVNQNLLHKQWKGMCCTTPYWHTNVNHAYIWLPK